MTAHELLTRALLNLAEKDQRPRCSDPVTHKLWTSEDERERAAAIPWCAGCPILEECAAVGAEETFGVWAGVDRSPKTRRAQTAA